MSPIRASLFSALHRAAAFTIRGAAITLGSTLVSCAAACYIERGAHRLVYHYFPHKYANVEWANGLTQEQLDAVRIYNRQPQLQQQQNVDDNEEKNTVVYQRPLPGALLWEAAAAAALPTRTLSSHEDSVIVDDFRDTARRPSSSSSSSTTTTQFWKEQSKAEQQQQKRETVRGVVASFVQPLITVNEIQSCAMTG
jgi:hypothetical protein